MTIRRGEPWGTRGALAADAPVFERDGAASAYLSELAGNPGADTATGDDRAVLAEGTEFGLLGGDIHTTLGSPHHDEAALRAGDATRFPLDAGLVEATLEDGGSLLSVFIAHLVAMEGRRVRGLFSTRTVVVMNASHRGRDDLGPRAHPNDGRLDVTDGQLMLGDRLRARRRMPSGSHLPHPMLATSRAPRFEFIFSRPASVELDGRPVGRVTAMSVLCLADAVTVVA